MCGEKAKLPDCASSMRGSPPRVRGEVDGSAAVPVSWGITPACAGRRLTMQYPDTGVQDHPRVCGEKFVFIDHSSFPLGSPPRVRGEAGPDQGAQGVARITPACAGRRFILSVIYARSGDHPRVCGEKGRTDKKSGQKIGSPPRVRGEE